ncbi:MAG TPA: undecaprenyldiphospho-muramoylpentapeptide beta-N-acetylglucosaminyltransferase [Trueperaceae bacterium]|nr:undecaprenyldiphospho-muramoylpentapeptide beta-N-acetylglucosaminyltransferase [Trueperaceae bacterium]
MKDLIVFATGGTGGHIFPAIAVANETAKEFRIAFIGSKNGMEARIIPEAGFDFYGVATGKLDRTKPNPLVLINIIRGLISAIGILKKLKPKLVIGFGGFASFPGVMAAKILKIPFILDEGNAFPGRVTRWFAKSTDLLVYSYPEALKYLPEVKQSKQIAYPVREKIIDRLVARRKLNLPEQGLVSFVMGGSQGSVFLNNEVPKAFESLGSSTNVLHQSGEKWQSDMKNKIENIKNYQVVGFVDASLAWSAADIAICRSGVGTLSEAAFYGVPCIMVPLPSSSEDHQLHNARAFAKSGAGWVVEQKDISKLSQTWQNALDPKVLKLASTKAKERSPAGAAKQFSKIIKDLINEKDNL